MYVPSEQCDSRGGHLTHHVGKLRQLQLEADVEGLVVLADRANELVVVGQEVLEEAAGVTKYKERRKETENRIADTRENLTRVEDIRLELGAQMERLEGQAAVARQYRDFSAELARKQHLLWLLRRNEAQVESERLAREVERAGIELEAQNAALRETEARLEEARENHFAASDGVHGAQGELFTANAEVARLEAEIRHRRESQHEYESRLAQLGDDQVHWQSQLQQLEADQARWLALSALSDERVEQGEMRLAERRKGLPLAEEAHASAQDEVNRQLAAMAQADQRLQIEQTARAEQLAKQEDLRKSSGNDAAILANQELIKKTNEAIASLYEPSGLTGKNLKDAFPEPISANKIDEGPTSGIT